jgi:hypothetical protein
MSSSKSSSSFDYTTSDEEFDMEEEEDIAMVLALHERNNKRSKRGSSVLGTVKLRRERIDADQRLMRNYFIEDPIYPERWFRHWFRMGTELFRFIAKAVTLRDPFFEQRRNAAGQRDFGSGDDVARAS